MPLKGDIARLNKVAAGSGYQPPDSKTPADSPVPSPAKKRAASEEKKESLSPPASPSPLLDSSLRALEGGVGRGGKYGKGVKLVGLDLVED